MARYGQTFEAALAATRAGNLFTTHTAVPAGFDRFAPALIEQYLGDYARSLALSLHELLALGRLNPDDRSEPFNMAYLAIRGSGAVNGVSRLHGQVSRRIFLRRFLRAGRKPKSRLNISPMGFTCRVGIPGLRTNSDDSLRKGPLAGHRGNAWRRYSPRFGGPTLATAHHQPQTAH